MHHCMVFKGYAQIVKGEQIVLLPLTCCGLNFYFVSKKMSGQIPLGMLFGVFRFIENGKKIVVGCLKSILTYAKSAKT